MVDFSEFLFGREEARSKGVLGGWVFLVCNFLADQVRFWAFLFLVCIILADREHLGGGIPLRRMGFRSLRSRYPGGGEAFKGLKGLGRGAARWAFP